jgi:hypothetical protein
MDRVQVGRYPEGHGMRVIKIAFGLLLIVGGFNALALKRIDRKLERFEADCTEICRERSDNPVCATWCHCVVGELKAQHPNKRELAAYLTAADARIRAGGSVMSEPEVESIARSCMERVQR